MVDMVDPHGPLKRDIAKLVDTFMAAGDVVAIGSAAKMLTAPSLPSKALSTSSVGGGISARAELSAASRGYYARPVGKPVPFGGIVSDRTPRLSYGDGFRLGDDLSAAGFELSLGRYPSNVSYVKALPRSYTIDRPWGWTPNYNAGAVRGHLEAGGRVVFTSTTEGSQTFRLEATQVLDHFFGKP
jgi:hypothetical protein